MPQSFSNRLPSMCSRCVPFIGMLLAFGIALPLRSGPANARSHGTGLSPIAYGRPAPNFAFDRAPGPASLYALRGRAVVVNFWATYCEPCEDELDVFARLPKAYGDAVALVTVSDQTHDLIDGDLQGRGVDAITVSDPARKIFALYGVTPIPVTLVLTPAGTVSFVSIGELDWPELSAAIDQVLPVAPMPTQAAPGPSAT